MRRKTAQNLATDRTRITPVITSGLYVRLTAYTGARPGAMSTFCERAIERELQRIDTRALCGNED